MAKPIEKVMSVTDAIGQFVEKLDYFTSPGYLEGGDARDRSGLFPQGSGPTKLITQKGTFEFHPELCPGRCHGKSSSHRSHLR